ncbi:hypothetical protein KAR91_60345 [Candidatus Pacearchaeota archaeon]|nr:hypothetical protein [Candidatus Pacearchaeota archaeon]
MDTEYILQHNGTCVIDTHHSIDRMIKRGQASEDQLHEFFRAMIDRCLTLKNWHQRPSNIEYFVWSKKLQQGFIMAYKLDYRQPGDRKHFTVVTAYPPGDSKPASLATQTITIK